MAQFAIVDCWLCVLLTVASLGCPTKTQSTTSGNTTPIAEPTPTADAEIETFLTSYFTSWSDGNMVMYESLFEDSATIFLVENGKVVMQSTLAEFIEMQSQFITNVNASTREYMTAFEMDRDEIAASVTLDWTLESGADMQTGVDRFTLMQNADGDWKILSLLYYEL